MGKQNYEIFESFVFVHGKSFGNMFRNILGENKSVWYKLF